MQRLIGEREFLQEVGKVRRGPKGYLAPFQRVSQWSDLKKPLSWASTGSLQEFYTMYCGFYRMFRNGIFEDGWLMEDAWMVMEVGWGFEVTQELMDGVVRWYVEGWFGFKVVETTMEKKVGLRGQEDGCEARSLDMGWIRWLWWSLTMWVSDIDALHNAHSTEWMNSCKQTKS